MDLMAIPLAVAKHVVITGASSGLGAALARAYAGPDVLLTLSGRHVERLSGVAADCRAAGAEVTTTICDVTDSEGMATWLLRADQNRIVDVVFANAGIGGKTAIAPPTGESNSVAKSILLTNTLGVINTATPIIPRFVARRAGHFVVVSSLAGLLGLPHSPAYCASKAAVRIYAQGLRRLMRPCGVRVTIINPGFVDTPMQRSLLGVGILVWSPERAADAIKRAIAKGKAEFTFPWPLRLVVGAAQLLPARVVDAALVRLSTLPQRL